VSRPACKYWRAQAKKHGTTYGRLINTATGLLLIGGAGQSNYVAAKAGINAFTEAVATEMAPYGVTANAIMPGANTRLAQIGWRTQRSIDNDAIDNEGGTEAAQAMRDPVHVAELGCFLASPAAAGISGQTFQVHGGTIEHVQTWNVTRTWKRDDRGFRADDLAGELPLDAGPKPADRPPEEWTAARKS
jgi:3-oxoacyl-[acyl-carrier protein] reductase